MNHCPAHVGPPPCIRLSTLEPHKVLADSDHPPLADVEEAAATHDLGLPFVFITIISATEDKDEV